MKKRINISIEPLLIEWLREHAKKRYTSVSRLIADYIIKLMEQDSKRRQK